MERMPKAAEFSARHKLLSEIAGLADVAIFGALSETYRTCGRTGCHCQKRVRESDLPSDSRLPAGIMGDWVWIHNH